MAQGIQVAHKELVRNGQSSPWLTADMNGLRGGRRLLVAWEKHTLVLAQALGYSYIEGTGSQRRIVRHLPDQHPYAPQLTATGLASMHGVDVLPDLVLNPNGANGTTCSYGKCEMQFDYAFRPYPIRTEDEIETEFDRYTEVVTDVSSEYLALPAAQANVKWAEAGPTGRPAKGEIVPGSIGPVYPIENYCIRWYQIPYEALPEAAILNAIGTVNRYDFGRQVGTGQRLYFWPAGTLLMLGARWEFIQMPTGEPGWNAEYRFQYDRSGYNTILAYLSVPPKKLKVSYNGVEFTPDTATDGTTIYNYSDFYDLFALPPEE